MWPTKPARRRLAGVLARRWWARCPRRPGARRVESGSGFGCSSTVEQADSGRRSRARTARVDAEVRAVDLVAVGKHGDQVATVGQAREGEVALVALGVDRRSAGRLRDRVPRAGCRVARVEGRAAGAGHGRSLVGRAGVVDVDDVLEGRDGSPFVTPAPPKARGSVRALITVTSRALVVTAAAGAAGSTLSAPIVPAAMASAATALTRRRPGRSVGRRRGAVP